MTSFDNVIMFMLSIMQVALAYNGASSVDGGISSGGIVQSTFLDSLTKRVDNIFAELPNLKASLVSYLGTGKWPVAQSDAVLLWYSIPPPHVVVSAVEKIKPRAPGGASMLSLLRLLLPSANCQPQISWD
jgi:anaphase-promoting complex subunit 1